MAERSNTTVSCNLVRNYMLNIDDKRKKLFFELKSYNYSVINFLRV